MRYETDPDVTLVTYPAGGCLNHTSEANVADNVFLMDGVKVAEVFVPLVDAQFRDAQRRLADQGQAHDGHGLRHRLGCSLVFAPSEWRGGSPGGGDAQALHLSGSPSVSTAQKWFAASSTLILLDEDRRAGRVHEGDLVAFLWIGAGNGAMNGYATMVL